MPKAFPLEFRRDVVAVARKGEATLTQIAKDFGISEACLHRWAQAGRCRRRCSSWCHLGGGGGDPRVAETQSGARAGERDLAAFGGVLRSGVAPK